MAKVELRGIVKSFGPIQVISHLDLEIGAGEFVALVGPSGCGKSTLLRMIAGLEDPTEGAISIGGQRVNDRSPKDRGIAMVFQNYALYPHMSVQQNMEFSLKLSKLGAKEIAARIEEASEILGLQELLSRKPSQLSGGQKQRVAMGREIVRRPKVLLFDEPLSNLDAQLRSKVRAEIAQIHKKFKSTVIYVTHDQVEAMTLADRIAVLNRGNLEQLGSPMDVYHSPRTQFVAGFIGSPPMNFVPSANLPQGVAPAASRASGVRPENARIMLSYGKGSYLAKKDEIKFATGKVSLIEPLGATTYIHVRTPESLSLVVELRESGTESQASSFKIDAEVELWSDRTQFFHFNENGNSLSG